MRLGPALAKPREGLLLLSTTGDDDHTLSYLLLSAYFFVLPHERGLGR